MQNAAPSSYDRLQDIASKTSHDEIDDSEVVKLVSQMNYPKVLHAFSLIVLSVQELGKAHLTEDYFRSRKDISYNDYDRNFLHHQARIDAGTKLLIELELWHPVLQKRDFRLENLRQASLYVDYRFDLGIWVDPESFALPEHRDSSYSSTIIPSLLDLWRSGTYGHPLDQLLLAGEQFNLFSYSFAVLIAIQKAIPILEKRGTELSKDEDATRRFAGSVRFMKMVGEAEKKSNGDELAFIEQMNRYFASFEPQLAFWSKEFVEKKRKTKEPADKQVQV